MPDPRIPSPVATVVGTILGEYYYSHRLLNTLFMEHGAPGEPPDGNCAAKCTAWLKRASQDQSVDALGLLGSVLQDLMEVDNPRSLHTAEELQTARDRITAVLGRFGLAYRSGGRILGASAAPAIRSLESVLRSRDLGGVEVEFRRALDNVETDPAAAVTAACAIVESLCKVYIADEGLDLPNEQTVKPLWRVVQRHLGLDPAQVEDADLKRILSGLASVIDGLGALRTHVGSAHGRGRAPYRVAPRHARLAVNSAHSLSAFVLEAWDHRRMAG